MHRAQLGFALASEVDDGDAGGEKGDGGPFGEGELSLEQKLCGEEGDEEEEEEGEMCGIKVVQKLEIKKMRWI